MSQGVLIAEEQTILSNPQTTTFETSSVIKVKSILWKLRYCSYSAIKFPLDFILALISLIILTPPLIIIAILIRREDHGPAIFKQVRTGKNGKTFNIYKFRTMSIKNDVHDISIPDEKTRIGRILRKTSIDELPQLFNILKGDMSFIGPRPWIPEYFEAMNSEERRRTLVRPGITGLAQSHGRNALSVFEKISFDLDYVEHYSPLTDFHVLLASVRTVLSKQNVSAGKKVIRNELFELRRRHTAKIVTAQTQTTD